MKGRKHKARDFSYEDIGAGDTFSFTKKISISTVRAFAVLTDDQSPLHMNAAYARKTEFGGRIAHGMLLGSLFSTLVGMFCPGKRALYLSQDLHFRNPLKPGATVEVSGTVMRKSEATRVLELAMRVTGVKGIVYVDGTARVKVRER